MSKWFLRVRRVVWSELKLKVAEDMEKEKKDMMIRGRKTLEAFGVGMMTTLSYVFKT